MTIKRYHGPFTKGAIYLSDVSRNEIPFVITRLEY